jgi:tetratricopeptide (TPR) repeat protein
MTPPDSLKWQHEADSRNINTVLLSLDHSGGDLPNLDGFCRSQEWSTVYLDAKAAIFVRHAGTDNLFTPQKLSCAETHFDDPPADIGISGKSERFNYYLNSAAILVVLGRNSEAQRQLDLAAMIFSESSDLHFLRGLTFLYRGFSADAEREFRHSLEIEPSDQTSRALALLYKRQGRLQEAATVLGLAAERSPQPYQLYLELGIVQLDMGLPKQALITFDQSENESPFIKEGAALGASFSARVAEGRKNAWLKLAEANEAGDLQGEASRARQQATLAGRQRGWWRLAESYETRDLQIEALHARQQATSAAPPPVPQSNN